MQITNGLFDHMVLQRTKRNKSDAVFDGKCSATGALRAIVIAGGVVLRDFNGIEVGKARGGKFRGRLRGLPVGGPYTIALDICDSQGRPLEELHVEDVLVGDVWVLGGQSNMQGVGHLKYALKPQPMVRAFYMNDQWGVAKEVIHNMWDTVDQVHIDLSGGVRPVKQDVWGVCPALGFGQEMYRLTGVPQGLIACAHGGTSMSQWDPKLKKLGTRSLYGATVRRVRKNGGRVAGVLWYQGCSDANPDAAPLYTERMKKLVAAMRRDFGDPELPVAAVQISRVYSWGGGEKWWNSIQDQQYRLPRVIRRCTVVPAIDLDLDDLIHISGYDQNRLGKRLAYAMHALTGGKKAGKPPITVKRIVPRPNPVTGALDVIVEFDNVVGKLQAKGRPHGFEIVAQQPGQHVYRVDLDGPRAILKTSLQPQQAENLSVHYGLGYAPYCNITDSIDRSLPVFGPVPIGRLRALTGFVLALRVSKFLPSAGKLDSLAYPKNKADLELKTRSFAGGTLPFCDLHLELGKLAPEDVLVYYACEIECTEPMKLGACLGYDGPVKMWIDGRQVFHDPNGTNPAVPDRAVVRFDAPKGRHEILVALASNHGKAWGIFLRFERLGVPKRLLEKGPGSYTMPNILG